jgi:two-component system sensor histidine kinase ComP
MIFFLRGRKLPIIILALIGIQIWFAYLTFRYPYIGINLAKNPGSEWVVESLDPESVSQHLDIRIGDTIVSVDGVPPSEHPPIKKWGSIEQVDEIIIERNHHQLTVTTEGVSNSLSYSLLPFIAEIVCFTIALFINSRIKFSKSATLLALVFVCIGITFMSLGASIRGDALGKNLINTFLVLLPVVFLHFLIEFFKEKGNQDLPRGYLKYLYISVAVNFLFRCTFFFESFAAFYMTRITSMINIIMFILSISLSFAVLAGLYIKNYKSNSYLSTIIKVVWVALIISFIPIVTLSFLPLVLYNVEWVSSLYMGWFVLFFPLSFAYLLLTKQLYDIDIVLRRLLFTVIVALLPSGAIVLVNALIFQDYINLKYFFFSFIVVLVILTFVLYSVENMYTRLERVMFPRKHYLQEALKKISKDLTSISSFRDLKDLFLSDIVNTLQVYGGAIVFRHRDSIEMIREGDINQEEVEKIVVSDPSSEHPNLMKFEINRHEEYTSYLIMTQKKSNTKLGLEEVQWLGLIISYLAVSLENVYLIRKLTVKLNRLASQLPNEQEAYDFNWFRKLTFELQEQERVRIASDLHDTTMQDLFFLKRKLTALGDRPGLPADAKETIHGLVDYIEIINVNLRQSCFDLNPYLLQEIGLVRTIEKIIERESFSSPFQIRFDASGALAVERRDLETKRHIFRIVQELINNAKKHSEASFISLRLTTISGQVVLHYQDDGVGFDPEEMTAPDIGTSGVGIEQLRSRVLHLNGQLELDAHQGEGVSIRISFPMKGGKTA